MLQSENKKLAERTRGGSVKPRPKNNVEPRKIGKTTKLLTLRTPSTPSTKRIDGLGRPLNGPYLCGQNARAQRALLPPPYSRYIRYSRLKLALGILYKNGENRLGGTTSGRRYSNIRGRSYKSAGGRLASEQPTKSL